MKIDINAYNNHYHQSGKFIDKFQEGIKLIPFDSRNASAFDKNCSLQGTTGEFFRLWANDGTETREILKVTVIYGESRIIPVILFTM